MRCPRCGNEELDHQVIPQSGKEGSRFYMRRADATDG